MLATGDDARCAEHPLVVAHGACDRCGRFMCRVCTDTDSDVEGRPTCYSCRGALASTIGQQLAVLHLKTGVAAMAEALLVPTLALLSGETGFAWVSLWLAVPTFVFGAIGAATRSSWVLTLVGCGLLGLLCLMTFTQGLLALGVVLPIAVARWVIATGPLERELHRLTHQ